MKLLLLYLQPPYPPHSGGRIRRWEMLRFLARRHRVTLVYFDDSNTAEAPAPLHALCEQVVVVGYPDVPSAQDLELAKQIPHAAKQYWHSVMAQAIQALAPHSFDLVLVDTLYMSVYRDLLPPQTVLLEQNIESQILKQFETTYTKASTASPLSAWRMLAMYENRIWKTFPLRVAVSRDDKQEMDRRCSAGRTIVVENGVDLASHPLLPISNEHTLIFTGAFNYFPNRDAAEYAAREIMPRIRQSDPNARLILAGSHPPHELVEQISDPHIEVIGNPSDMTEVAKHASVSIVPLRMGSGTRLKILEAFAWGLPVVSTSIGCSGLDVANECDLLVQDDPEAFAQAVVRLWADPTLYATLRQNARRRAEEGYDWQPILERMDAELLQLKTCRV